MSWATALPAASVTTKTPTCGGRSGVRLGAGRVNVLALNAHDAANLQLLADDGGEGVQTILDGALAHGGGEQRVQVGSLGGDGGGQDLVREVDELLVLGDEVGLRVDLDQHTDGAVGLSGQQAGGGLAALALGQGLQALQRRMISRGRSRRRRWPRSEPS